MAEKENGSAKTISLVMVLTLVGKILGLLRDRLMTINYGSGMETNAFLTASRIPRVFFDAVFASAVAASFIPVFSEYLVKKGKREAIEFSGNFITIIGIFSLILTVLGMVFAEPIVRLFASYDPATSALCVTLTRMMFPTVLFTGVAFSFVGVLQSFDEFNVPALISVVANLIVIAYYYTFNETFGIMGLAAAFLIGWFAQAAVQVPSLRKKGFFFKPSFSLNSAGMKKVFLLMLPVMVSTWVQPINMTLNAKFGSRLFEGAGVTAIELSNNLFLIITGVFILSVTNVIYPRLSKMNAASDAEGFSQTLGRTVRASLYFIIPMTAGLMVLARPVVELIYGGGAFDDFSVTITSQALTFVSLGMIGYALQMILTRAYFARQDSKTPLIAGVVSVAVNIVLCVVLIEPLDVTGLAIASAAAATAGGIVLIIPLEVKKIGFLTKSFVLDSAKMALCALVMAAAAYGLKLAVGGLASGGFGKLLTAAVPALGGVVVYAAGTLILKVGEAQTALATLRRAVSRLRRKQQ